VTLPRQTGFFGHPAGLRTLFFAELWERFSYYGMRALLVLFMTAPIAAGGLGWSVAKAGPIYGLYTAMVYLLALPGGWIADRILGQRKSVFWGGVVIMMGHIALAIPSENTFYLGLALVVVGTGLLKPNISTMVGRLYAPDDARRDAGFSIFYMGINLGALLAPLVTASLAQEDWFKRVLTSWGFSPVSSWHWAFGATAVGMFLGLVWYVVDRKTLGEAGLHPEVSGDEEAARVRIQFWRGFGVVAVIAVAVAALHLSGTIVLTANKVSNTFGVLLLLTVVVFFAWLFLSGGWTSEERKRLVVIAVLFLGAAVFWSVFEQAGSTLNLFAERNTQKTLLGKPIPAAYFQSLNSLFIVMLAPLFAWLWVRLGRHDPSSPAKFTIGLVFVALGFAVLIVAAQRAQQGVLVSPLWLTATYLLHTIGELCLSPVGLSAMTRLAPARIAGLTMGIWFLGASVGNYLGGRVAGLYESFSLPSLFGSVTLFALGAAAVLALLVRPIQRMLARS
jgi:POT family proton-dependent oligopeptide transporter